MAEGEADGAARVFPDGFDLSAVAVTQGAGESVDVGKRGGAD